MLSFTVNAGGPEGRKAARGAIPWTSGGEMPVAYIGLGSNLGDRLQALRLGAEALEKAGVRVLKRSSLYRTDPVEVVDQGEFVNQVLGCSADLPPDEILAIGLGIERSLGRTRTRDKGPRTLDIDLLLHADTILRTVGLEVPHPRMHLRAFVLVPLVEIAPDARHPVLRLTARELLERCPDRSRVERIAEG